MCDHSNECSGQADRLIFLRPLDSFALINEIAESGPFKLFFGDWTPQFDFVLADANHFPITPAPAFLNAYSLPDLKRIWTEPRDSVHRHATLLTEKKEHFGMDPSG